MSDDDLGEQRWAVLFHDPKIGWKPLIGGESCSHSEAEATIRQLEARGLRGLIVSRAHVEEHGLPEGSDLAGYLAKAEIADS